MRMLSAMIFASSFSGGLAAAKGPTFSADSGPSKNLLLELYTSEGCSSCPPADRWLSSLAPTVSRDRLVPLSLHVDYWNQLGWSDPFSDARFSARQHALGGERIYTPELFLDGEEASREALAERVAKLAAAPAVARIHVEATLGDDTIDLEIRAARSDGKKEAQLFVALYESNLSSAVRSGENRGRELRHDFVVRRFLGPLKWIDGEVTLHPSIALDRSWKRADLGIVVFAEEVPGGKILQALRLPLAR